MNIPAPGSTPDEDGYDLLCDDGLDDPSPEALAEAQAIRKRLANRRQTFREGDEASYVSVHGPRVWWRRDEHGRWWPSDGRDGSADDGAVRDLLRAREHAGRDDVEFRPSGGGKR